MLKANMQYYERFFPRGQRPKDEKDNFTLLESDGSDFDNVYT